MQVIAPSSRNPDHAGPEWMRLTARQKLLGSSAGSYEEDDKMSLAELAESFELSRNIVRACIRMAEVQSKSSKYDYDDVASAVSQHALKPNEILSSELESWASTCADIRREAENAGVVKRHRDLDQLIVFLDSDVPILSRYVSERNKKRKAEERAFYRERARRNTQIYRSPDDAEKQKVIIKERNKTWREKAKLGRLMTDPKTPEEIRIREIYERSKACKNRYNQARAVRYKAEGKKLPTYKRAKGTVSTRVSPEGYMIAREIAKIYNKGENTISRRIQAHPELVHKINRYRYVKTEDVPKLMEGTR